MIRLIFEGSECQDDSVLKLHPNTSMHTVTHTLTYSHINFRVNKLGVMGDSMSYVTTGSKGTRNRIHIKALYLENTLLILSHTLATVLVTL